MLNYLYKKGSKTTVLFLHGWGGNCESFKSTFDFVNSYGYPVLSVDFAGFGKSEKPTQEYFVKDYVNDVKNLLFELKINTVFVVAHSFGARVASILNSEFNVKKLVITGGAGLKPKFNIFTFFKIKVFKIKKFLVKKNILKKHTLKKYGSDDYKNLSENDKKTFVNVVNQNLANYFKNINCKTLLFWGKNDTETPLYMAKKLNKLIKNSELVVENGTHFAYIENDFLFKNIVVNFFEGD